MRQLTQHIKQQQLFDWEQTDQVKLELRNYIRKFAITYSKKISQNARKSMRTGKILIELDSNLTMKRILLKKLIH